MTKLMRINAKKVDFSPIQIKCKYQPDVSLYYDFDLNKYC